MAKKTPEENITGMFREAESALEDAMEEWNRFTEDGVKKGFKESRKAVLVVKKAAADIRKAMALISPKREKKKKATTPSPPASRKKSTKAKK